GQAAPEADDLLQFGLDNLPFLVGGADLLLDVLHPVDAKAAHASGAAGAAGPRTARKSREAHTARPAPTRSAETWPILHTLPLLLLIFGEELVEPNFDVLLQFIRRRLLLGRQLELLAHRSG